MHPEDRERAKAESTEVFKKGAGVIQYRWITKSGHRAERVLQGLLEGIGRSRARVVILDITGVPTVDAETAEALTRTAKAVRLLGAEVVLTGIRPEIARILVALGTELDGIVTRGSLQSGIAYAMARR